MKIIGFVAIGDATELVLKGDSALLNGRKPMFIPDGTQDLRATPCSVLRISRLGKNIGVRFADRYYDAIAPGADFTAYDLLEEARAQGRSWTPAISFDFSLAIGVFGAPETCRWTLAHADGSEETLAETSLLLSPEEAIHRASQVMTLRQGDLIYIAHRTAALPVRRDDCLSAAIQNEEKLYCKIK